MKRYWPTALMAVILVALAFYLYLVEFPAQQTQQRQESAKKKVVSIEERQITSVIFRADRDELVFERTADKGWLLIKPIQAEADNREIQSLIRAVVLGSVHRVVDENPADLTPFGLDKPVAVVTIKTGLTEETLSIGDTGPLSSTLYVLRTSDHSLLLTDLAPKDFVNKSLMTFRKKDVLRLTSGDIDRVRLTYPTTEIVLYRVSDKPKPKWKIRYPVEADADLNEVRMLLFRLEDLKAMSIVDPGPARDALARTLNQPKVKVTLHTPDGEQAVKLYQPDPSTGEAFAETTSEAPLYRINPTFVRDFTKELYHLQDKRLLGAEENDIALLSVKTRGEAYTLINQNGDWVLEDRPTDKVDQQAIHLFLSRVVSVPSEERVVKQPGPLAPYGLVNPAAEFVATGKDGKLVGKLSIGDQANGLAFAMGHRLPGIYHIRADLLNQIPTRAALLSSDASGHSP
jgi:Domain of unknown function (DUF4340)